MSDHELQKLRHRFFSRFRKVFKWGGETIDTAWTYYPSVSNSSSAVGAGRNK